MGEEEIRLMMVMVMVMMTMNEEDVYWTNLERIGAAVQMGPEKKQGR